MLKYFYEPVKIKVTSEGQRSLVETPPKVIGEGTYGCVHRPPLRCDKKKLDYKGKISKLGLKKNIDTEIAEYKTIDRVDKRAIFYPGIPNSCLPSRDIVTLEAVDQCSNFTPTQMRNYKLLVMRDGGENLEDFANEIAAKLVANPETAPVLSQQMERFWIEAHRMFLGILKFLQKGVIHHDLKHKNIVYNAQQNRINFIDFGLMTTADKIKIDARKSTYGFSIRHWSFPPETLFLNRNRFAKFTGAEIPVVHTSNKASAKKVSAKRSTATAPNPRLVEFNRFLREFRNSASHINTYFAITDPEFQEKKQKSFAVQEHTNEYYRMVVNSLHKHEYEMFLDLSISTIDSYGLAIALIYVLNKTHSLISEQFADDLYFLFFNMMNFNVMERVSLEDAISRYEDILQNNRILVKYNQHFENHKLMPNGRAILNASRKLARTKIPDVVVSQARIESDPASKCPENTSFDKKRKRCTPSVKLRSSRKISKRKTAKKVRFEPSQTYRMSVNL